MGSNPLEEVGQQIKAWVEAAKDAFVQENNPAHDTVIAVVKFAEALLEKAEEHLGTPSNVTPEVTKEPTSPPSGSTDAVPPSAGLD